MQNSLLVGFCVGCAVAWYSSIYWPAPAPTARQHEFPLHFLVVGDWGRDGAYNQSLVATQMGRMGRVLKTRFVVSTGDNFYDAGLKGVNDGKFKTSFTDIYSAPSLQTRWYAVLGNHDYMGDVLAQLDPFLQERDSRWFCHREHQLQLSLCEKLSPEACNLHVEFFFIDTTPFVNDYWKPTKTSSFDWRGLVPQKDQLQRLRNQLDASTAIWKVVIGHHTIRSLGPHGETVELIQQLLPILEEHQVDLYFNGHDHCLQHIKRLDSNVHFVTSGGGSKAWEGLRHAEKENGVLFAYDGQGFAAVSMSPNSVLLSFHDALGNTLYGVRLDK